MKSFKTSINEFDATFKLEGENLLIELQCMNKKEILLAHYTQDSIP